MTPLYVDGSVVLRIVLHQPGVRAPVGPGSVVLSSELIRVETARALDRLRAGGILDDAEHTSKLASADALLSTFHLMPMADEILEGAREKFPMGVGVLDAIHAATARLLLPEAGRLHFWTHLPQQALAAIARGLDVRGVTLKA